MPYVVTRLALTTGAGSANLGAAMLLHREAGVPLSSIFMTNSRGLMWKVTRAHKRAHTHAYAHI